MIINIEIFSFKRENFQNGQTFVKTPESMCGCEAGDFLELSIFRMLLAVVVKAKSELEWDENKEISG